MRVRQKIVTSVFTAVAFSAMVLGLRTQFVTAQEPPALKLEGAWIAKVQGSPVQWIYTMSPGPSRRSAALHADVVVHFPGTPTASDLPPIPVVGEIVQTGPDTAAFNTFFYNTQKNQIVTIGRDSGTVTFLGPDKAEATHHFEIFAASADADGDGLPDPGVAPLQTFTVVTHDTRIPSP